eukprot:scaffold254435_cov18-Tisochrysis_lutea.AAC.1
MSCPLLRGLIAPKTDFQQTKLMQQHSIGDLLLARNSASVPLAGGWQQKGDHANNINIEEEWSIMLFQTHTCVH